MNKFNNDASLYLRLVEFFTSDRLKVSFSREQLDFIIWAINEFRRQIDNENKGTIDGSSALREMLSKQERLGADFEKVLYDNLWSLYEE
jgi:hypothetical protein